MKVTIDLKLCEGNMKCQEAAPEVFEVRDDDKSRLLIDHPPERIRLACSGYQSVNLKAPTSASTMAPIPTLRGSPGTKSKPNSAMTMTANAAAQPPVST